MAYRDSVFTAILVWFGMAVGRTVTARWFASRYKIDVSQTHR